MNCMNAVDTNVLMYVHDPRDPRKQAIAEALVRTLTDGALSWQVACEYLSTSRNLVPLGFDPEQAWRDVARLRQVWTPLLPEWPVLGRAKDLRGRYSLSHWDSLLVAACLHAGVKRIYSENFSGYTNVDGLEIVSDYGFLAGSFLRPDSAP